MPENGAKLTVFFQEPFWVGLYERWTEGLLQVCKITFGAEPKDYQVYEFLLNHWTPQSRNNGRQGAGRTC